MAANLVSKRFACFCFVGKKLWVSVVAVVEGGAGGGLCGSCVLLAVSLLLWFSRYHRGGISGWGR
eukprot:14770215-Ditylum_brightwellii.AAC.1